MKYTKHKHRRKTTPKPTWYAAWKRKKAKEAKEDNLKEPKGLHELLLLPRGNPR